MDGFVTEEKVEKIRSFTEKAYETERRYKEEITLTAKAIEWYNRKLDETLQSLHDHVKRQEHTLQKLRESKRDSSLPRLGSTAQSRLAQIRQAKDAYASLLQAEPELPAPDSPITGLVALRETSRVLDESKLAIQALKNDLTSSRQRLRIEEDHLRDANLITQHLEARIERLRSENSEKAYKGPAQLAEEVVQAEHKKNNALDRDMLQLKDALDRFIDKHLAAMLAAEDLGGPIVGDALIVSDPALAAGYTSHGKPKKLKVTAAEEAEDPGQQRIELFLANKPNAVAPTNRREAAAMAMHSLLDALLEAGPSYIDLPLESAASRFLVRAKIAQLHPRDAHRIRLIDFGRSLGD